MKKQLPKLCFAFLLGYFCHDLALDSNLIPKAYADLTGIDYYELRGDDHRMHPSPVADFGVGAAQRERRP